jgi:hypothetical protein
VFGKTANQKRVKKAIPEFADCMMQWNLDRKTALEMGETFANTALASAEGILSLVDEDTNLAQLFLSGAEPRTPYGVFFSHIFQQYEKQRKADGVSASDIEWYWSMPVLERELIREMSNAYRMALSIRIMQSRAWDSQEMMWDATALEVDRNTVNYGFVPSEDLNLRDKKRPIPFELYRRIENYRQYPYPSEAKERLVKLDNQNAFIRQQLKLGAL